MSNDNGRTAKIQVEKLHIIFCHASPELSKPYSYQKLLQKGGQYNPQIIAIWPYIPNTRFLSKIYFFIKYIILDLIYLFKIYIRNYDNK